MVRLRFELHLPGLVIGVEDIKMTGLGRRFGRAKPAGPYLITGRSSGLALDTGQQYDPGGLVIAWPPHAHPHQLWYLRPSGVKGEATIISAANGLALDSNRETSVVPTLSCGSRTERRGSAGGWNPPLMVLAS